MVDLLSTLQAAAKFECHHKPVFHDVTVALGHRMVRCVRQAVALLRHVALRFVTCFRVAPPPQASVVGVANAMGGDGALAVFDAADVSGTGVWPNWCVGWCPHALSTVVGSA